MGRGPRRRVERGIYADRYGFAVQVTVAQQTVEHRFPADATRDEMRTWRAGMARALQSIAPKSRSRSFADDVDEYIAQVQHLASWRELRSELRAWVARVGARRRHEIAPSDVYAARSAWLAAGVAPKTVNQRVSALRRLWRFYDGKKRAVTPVDEIDPLPVPQTRKLPISAAVILAVAQELLAREQRGVLRNGSTRARFLVQATTGARPSEIMRAVPEDLGLDGPRPYWSTRDGKGGRRPGALPLNPDMVAAWRLFVAEDAWGRYETSSFCRVLRAAGWPADVRPYHLRSTVGIRLSEAGTDLADVAGFLGHTTVETTRTHYVPVLDPRMVAASARLADRLDLTDQPAARSLKSRAKRHLRLA